ncbi:ABC transporter ATP-binding protein, partial [Acidomonas methanolica]
MNDEAVLSLRRLVRRFRSGDEIVTILDGAGLELRAGEIVALVAPSGTGKSTLLHLAGLLEAPESGEILVGGRSAGRMGDRGRTEIRRDEVGFVYQFHHLLAEFTARENVMMPQLIAGVGRREAAERADGLLRRFGLG